MRISTKEFSMDENKDIRTIDELIDLPYSEMTDEEIELVVNFKANNIFMDMQAQAEREMIQNNLNEQINIMQENAEHSRNLLDSLCNISNERFEKAN